MAKDKAIDVIALSTYNGVALRYSKTLLQKLSEADLAIPVLIGGRLNEIPEGSNTSLPVDVSAELVELGVLVCPDLETAAQSLRLVLVSDIRIS